MGNKLGCNCGPLSRKPYRYEENQWSATSSSRSFGKRDGHLLRLWAEVFHVTTAGGGTVKWQQVSEDLVPVNITCIQDSPEVVFHITAYNSQVDKILDVRLVQPGTRIGQASECFVYWKDPVTSDTWGLNFTSPIDAKQFRECCSPAFKFSRKASSSYSLKDNNTRGPVSRSGTLSGTASRGGSGRINATSTATGRRRPLSTPTSPSKSREPQCTCMTAEQYARLRAMDPRFRAASTLPRATPTQQPRQDGGPGGGGREKGSHPTDNYATVRRGAETKGTGTVSDMDGEGERDGRPGRERGPGDGGGSRGRGSGRGGREIVSSKSVDYSDNELAARETIDRKKSRSKSTDDVTERSAQAGGNIGGRRGVPGSGTGGGHHQQQTEAQGTQTAYPRSRTLPGKSTIGTNTTPTGDGLTDSHTLKRLLKPISTTGSVATSPEMGRRIYHHDGYISEPEIRHVSSHTQPGKRATDTLRRVHERSRGVGTQTSYGKFKVESSSPPSDQPVFDHAYYATTPPSSSPEGEGQTSPSPGSPTARLLLEYEQHLRNTLAKGMDAESYSLHTFEAIISQSNENLAAVPPNSRSTTLPRLGGGPSRENFRISHDASREASRDSDVLSGYYSDFRDRGYLSDHNSRTSGYYDRIDSGKSGYFSDREGRSGYYSDREVHSQKYGSVRQQASVESADSRLCYLTSSESSERKQAPRPAPTPVTTTNGKSGKTTADKKGAPNSSRQSSGDRTPQRPTTTPPPPPPPPLPPPPPPPLRTPTGDKPPPEITIIPASSSNPSPDTRADERIKTVIIPPHQLQTRTSAVTPSPPPPHPSSPGDTSKSVSLLTPTRTKPKLFPKPVLSPRPPPKKLSIPPRPSGGSADSSLSLSPAASESSISLAQSPVKGKVSPIYSEPFFEEEEAPSGRSGGGGGGDHDDDVSKESSTSSSRVTFAPTATVVESSPVRTPSPPPKDYYEDESTSKIGERRKKAAQNDSDDGNNDDDRAWSPAKSPATDVSHNTGRFTVRILPSPSHVRFISQPQPHHVVLRSPRKEAGVATVIPADAPIGTEEQYYPTTVRTLPNPKRQKFGVASGGGEKGHVRFASEAELYPPPRDDYSPEEDEQQHKEPKKTKESKKKTEPTRTAVKSGDDGVEKVRETERKKEQSAGKKLAELLLCSPKPITPLVQPKSTPPAAVQPKFTPPAAVQPKSTPPAAVQPKFTPPAAVQPTSAASLPPTSTTTTFTQSNNTIVIELSKCESSNNNNSTATEPIITQSIGPPPIKSRNTIQIDLTRREPISSTSSPAKSLVSEEEEGKAAEGSPPTVVPGKWQHDISEGLFWKTAEAGGDRNNEAEDDEDEDDDEEEDESEEDKSPVHIHYDPEQAKTVITFASQQQQQHQKKPVAPLTRRVIRDERLGLTLPGDSEDEEDESDDESDAWADEPPERKAVSKVKSRLPNQPEGKAVVAKVIPGFFPVPSVPSPTTASPSSASQSSSSTTGPTTVVLQQTLPTTTQSGIPATTAHPTTQKLREDEAEPYISPAAAAAIYSTTRTLLPTKPSNPTLVPPHLRQTRHSHLSHYNSIQELYTFVSEVLSSQAESRTANNPAVVTAAGAQNNTNQPPYTLCKYHLKQRQQKQKQQQLLLHQQYLLFQQKHQQQKAAGGTSAPSSSTTLPHRHHHRNHHQAPPQALPTSTSHQQIQNLTQQQAQSQTLPTPHHQHHQQQQQHPPTSSTTQKQQTVVAQQRQQNGQDSSALLLQQHHQHYVQQAQQQAPHAQNPQPGVVAARTMTLAQNLTQQQRHHQHHPQTSNQNIYRPVLPGLVGDHPSTIPRKGATNISSANSTPGGKGTSATLPHPHSQAAAYHHQQTAHPPTSSHHHPHLHHQYQQQSAVAVSSVGESVASGASGMVTTTGRAQSTGPTSSTSAFYSTLTPIRQPTQQPHAFQPVPQRHQQQSQQHPQQQSQQHPQQQQLILQQQFRTPTHHHHHHHHPTLPGSSSSSSSRYPIQRSVSVAAASTSTTNYSAVQALAASKQYPGTPIQQQSGTVVVSTAAGPIAVVASSSGVFQPLASAPSLLTGGTGQMLVQQQPVSINLSSSYDYATIQHVQQQQRIHQQQQLAIASSNKQLYAQHATLQHHTTPPHQQQQILPLQQQQQQHYYYNPLEHPAYANFYQPSESLTGHEEPISRPVSNLSNKSSEHFYTYPYPRKQQDQIFKPIDWCTLVHWARKAVQSREDDNDIKCECSHGCHEIKGLKRHDHMHNWPHVQPHECNVLFLAKVMQRISDDERMSLTTAVSDDEPGDGANSPKGSRKPAASFNCTGAVRKAGFLSVKKWLLRKRHQVELARRRGWKGYWVCLKGTTLLFYPCDARETSRSVEAAPKHLIIVDGAIMQPIPEHPKRDYIFCLSTAFGDAYLFQAPCQVELESWVHSIHWACAAAFARHRGKTGTLHLLQEEIIRLDKAIESDGKLRHMAELQRSVVADPETRSQLAQQIATWEENIERLHCEQFRLRCYMASLQGGELPNPKSLLSHVSRTTKNTLNRLGVFTVSSFHAYVCARSPSLLSNLLAGRGATKRRAPLLSRSNSASSRRSLHVSSSERENERSAKISLPDNQVVTVPLKDAMSVEEFLVSACARKGLAPMEHFVRVKKRRELPDTNYFVPHRSDLIDTYLSTHEVVEVRAKLLYQVELSRSSLDQMWGFSVEAELVENADRQDELCCYVSRVEERSVAMSNGIIKGDEILVINGAIVSDLDMMYIESVLQEELSLCLMLRSSRTEPPALAAALAAADAAIAQLVCPPPPADPLVLTEDILSHLIVPAPHENKDLSPSDTEELGGHASGGEQGGRASRADSTEIESLLKTAEQVTGICRTKEQRARAHPQHHHHHHPLTHQRSSAGSLGAESPVAGVSGGSSPTHGVVVSSIGVGGGSSNNNNRDVEKTKKVVLELIDTERAYVKHLTCLLEQYLEPLRHERFLSANEMMAIFGNIREMVSVQRRFLKSLEGALDSSAAIEGISHPADFKNILLNIASAFLSFADHFKLYSSFCASHSKAQKLLHPTEGNHALQQFLAARNPRQQHSNTLESYLIKPIQRILKYPLLLQQLRNLCDTNSEEYRNLVEALQCMERVAEHINEMQRIHEEYGAIFEHLFRQHQKLCKTQIDLSPGDLLHYGGVEWLNIADFLGKIKKGLELHAMCFVFRTAVVFLCKERLRHKKKLMGSTSKVSDKSEVEIIRYQVLIPVSEVQVRQIGDPKLPDTPPTTAQQQQQAEPQNNIGSTGLPSSSNYSWELVHLRNQAARRSEKVYLLSNSTGEFRNAFLRNIRQIIRESVRNMSLPPRFSSSDIIGGGGEDDEDVDDDLVDEDEGRDGERVIRGTTSSQGGGLGDNASAVVIGSSTPTGSSHYATPEGSDLRGQASGGSGQRVGHYHRGGHGHMQQAQTLGRKKPPKPPQRHSAGNLEMGAAGRLRHQDSTDSNPGGVFRSRSKTMSDAAAGGEAGSARAESVGEGGAVVVAGSSVTMPRVKGMLGNTPIHLTLSTTSTLSAGSTGSAAKLIQSSSTPGRGRGGELAVGRGDGSGGGGGVGGHHGHPLPEPSSPIWKPREATPFDSQTLPRKSGGESTEPQPSTSQQATASTSSSKGGKAETLPRPPR